MTTDQAIRALGVDFPLANRIILLIGHMDPNFPMTNGDVWFILNEDPDEVARVMCRMQEVGWLQRRTQTP